VHGSESERAGVRLRGGPSGQLDRVVDQRPPSLGIGGHRDGGSMVHVVEPVRLRVLAEDEFAESHGLGEVALGPFEIAQATQRTEELTVASAEQLPEEASGLVDVAARLPVHGEQDDHPGELRRPGEDAHRQFRDPWVLGLEVVEFPGEVAVVFDGLALGTDRVAHRSPCCTRYARSWAKVPSSTPYSSTGAT
jgi:hypothetical protein